MTKPKTGAAGWDASRSAVPTRRNARPVAVTRLTRLFNTHSSMPALRRRNKLVIPQNLSDPAPDREVASRDSRAWFERAAPQIGIRSVDPVLPEGLVSCQTWWHDEDRREVADHAADIWRGAGDVSRHLPVAIGDTMTISLSRPLETCRIGGARLYDEALSTSSPRSWGCSRSTELRLHGPGQGKGGGANARFRAEVCSRCGPPSSDCSLGGYESRPTLTPLH